MATFSNIYKKSQAAMEFLMTYGWAILVVLIAIGALAYFGVLKPNQFLPEKCVIDISSGLYCEDFTANDLNDITLRIKNIMEKNATIVIIDVTTGLEGFGKTLCSNLDGGIIAGDSSEDFIIRDGCDLQVGDKIKGEITIFYKRDGFQKTTTGTLISYVNAAGGEAGPDQGICQNAEDGELCDGLDLVFGEGYQAACCEDFGLCC